MYVCMYVYMYVCIPILKHTAGIVNLHNLPNSTE